MDMVHEELLYTEHANELLQQKIIDTEMQLEDSKRALENANTEVFFEIYFYLLCFFHSIHV